MVRAGETSGKLSQSLTFLANHLEREYNLKSKIRGAMIYPALVLVVFLAIFGLMMFSILPSFENILKEREVEVPFITKVILSFSKILREKFLYFALILGASVILIFYYLKTEEGRKLFDKISLKIPFFGEISKLSILSRFAQNLSTLTSAGLTPIEALEIIEEIVGNEEYKNIVSKIKEDLKKGKTISSITALYPELFPPLFTQLILVGRKNRNPI